MNTRGLMILLNVCIIVSLIICVANAEINDGIESYSDCFKTCYKLCSRGIVDPSCLITCSRVCKGTPPLPNKMNQNEDIKG